MGARGHEGLAKLPDQPRPDFRPGGLPVVFGGL